MWDKNLKFQKNKSIAIFDSGFGGLFIMKEIIKVLPHEDVIYFGDNIRAPYGDRSEKEIIKHSLRIADFLNSLNIKVLILGCNTISACAYKSLKKSLKIDIFEIISPSVKKILKLNRKIGILATKATIFSKIYQRKILKYNKKMDLSFFSCPLFVSLVEKGVFDEKILEEAVRYYLKNIESKKIEIFFLGCTHYIFFKEILKKISNKKIIDSVLECVEEVKNNLKEKASFLNIPKYMFYTTKDKKEFKRIAEKILQMEDINVREKKNIIN